MKDYRKRVYERYAAHAMEGMTHLTPEDLAPRRPYLRHVLAQHFPADRAARILDLGCGHGAVLFEARELGYRNLDGVDGAPQQVVAARSLGLDMVRKGDIAEAIHRVPPTSLDVVVCFDVIEHLRKEEQLALMDGVFTALAPGGRLILHVPNGEAPMFGRVYFGDFTHEAAFTRRSVSQLLEAAGFSKVNCFEDKPVAHGVKSAVRSVLWHGIRGLLRFYIAVETGSTASNDIFSQNLLAVATKC